mgnify:CR=1 FL=1
MLGTPSKEELMAMNPNYQEFKFPQLRPTPLTNVFPPATPPLAIDVLNKLFIYSPDERPTAIQVCISIYIYIYIYTNQFSIYVFYSIIYVYI